MLYEKLQKVIARISSGEHIIGTNGLYRLGELHLTKKDINFLSRQELIVRAPTIVKYEVKLAASDKCKSINPYR